MDRCQGGWSGDLARERDVSVAATGRERWRQDGIVDGKAGERGQRWREMKLPGGKMGVSFGGGRVQEGVALWPWRTQAENARPH